MAPAPRIDFLFTFPDRTDAALRREAFSRAHRRLLAEAGDAQRAGFEAASNGITENPHPADNDLHAAWAWGYSQHVPSTY